MPKHSSPHGALVPILAIALSLLANASTATLTSPQNSEGQSGGWELIARRYVKSSAGKQLFWVGLKNSRSNPRIICLLTLSYAATFDDGRTQGGGVVGGGDAVGTHMCTDPAANRLILGGETLFSLVWIPNGEDWSDDQIVFGASVGQACPDEHPCSPSFILLTAKPHGRLDMRVR